MKLRNVLVAATLFGSSFVTQAQNQHPAIGFYIGDPTPSIAEPKYQAFVKLLKQTPNSTSLFIDYREPIWSAGTYDAKWRNNAAWHAGNLASLVSAEYLNRLAGTISSISMDWGATYESMQNVAALRRATIRYARSRFIRSTRPQRSRNAPRAKSALAHSPVHEGTEPLRQVLVNGHNRVVLACAICMRHISSEVCHVA
jgi:hypothetical protein